MKLPKNHILEYDGKIINWCVGDYVTYPNFIENTHWAFGVEEKIGWNTTNATYCGKFNRITRELYEIKKLPPKNV